MGSRSPRRDRDRRRSRSGSRDKSRRRSPSPKRDRYRDDRDDRGGSRDDRDGHRRRDDRDRDRPRRSRSPDRRRPSRSPGRRDRRSRSPGRRDFPPPPARGGDFPGPPPRQALTCRACGKTGHFARECPDKPAGGRGGGGGGRGGGAGCYKCGEVGHLGRNCPRERGGDNEAGQQWGRPEDEPEPVPEVEVEPDFGLSGKLAEESNTKNGVVLVYSEPPEARKPTKRWRLYVFKDGKPFGEPLHIHRQSSYLFGRNRAVADIPTDHPSCSGQHAVLQFRHVEVRDELGLASGQAVKPYIIDLNSTNGTFLNGQKVEPQRYVELLEQDMVKFGNSSREYVLLHEQMAGTGAG